MKNVIYSKKNYCDKGSNGKMNLLHLHVQDVTNTNNDPIHGIGHYPNETSMDTNLYLLDNNKNF